MKYIYTILMSGLFLIGHLLNHNNPIFQTCYATCMVAFLSYTNYTHYEQKRQQ